MLISNLLAGIIGFGIGVLLGMVLMALYVLMEEK